MPVAASSVWKARDAGRLRLDLGDDGELPAGRPTSGRRWTRRANSSSQPLAHVGDLGIGPAPAVAAVVGDQPLAQRLVGDSWIAGSRVVITVRPPL